MNSIITERIKESLKASPYWTQKTRNNGRTIQNLVCPRCFDKTAWAYLDAPLSINCNKGECSVREPTLKLLGINLNLEKEFAPTKEDKHRPARVYLECRGLQKSLENLSFEYWPGRRVRHGSAAVMFPVQSPVEKVWNGRLIAARESDGGKTHNKGSTSGAYWRHTGREYDPQKTTFVTEGIIDALSLIEAGQQAIAVLASGQDPEKVVLPPLGRLVFAFDNDGAGLAATKKWLAAYPDAGAIMPDKKGGMDWNDWLRSTDPDKAEEEFQKALPRFELNAKLALAATAREYADLYHAFHQRPPGIFSHNGSTFFSSTSPKGISVERIGRFTFSVTSFTRDTSADPEHPDYLYNLSVRLPGVPKPIQATATNKDLATLRGTREFFLGKCKTTFTGSQAAALAFGDKITSSKAPEVTQLTHTGYSPKTSWYVFHKWAVDETGKVHWADNNGLFKTGHRVWIQPPNHAAEKAITPALTGPGVKEIHQKLTAAFGDNGAAALAWSVASWQVFNIKSDVGFFPFLSLWGDPASAKSSLAVILNNLQGLDGEGLPVSQLSTKKALARSISRVSGLFTALLENNDRERSSFDYGVLLTGYNRGPLQLSARFTNDNQVREAPFLGSLLFVQNVEPFAEPSERQRVISLHFSHGSLNEATKHAYEQLIKIAPQQLARFILLVLQHRRRIEEQWQAEFEKATADLTGIDHQRIRGNHALVLAFHRLLCQLFDIDYDLKPFLFKTAQSKISSASQTSYTAADLFLEALVELNQDEKTASFLHLDEKETKLFVNLTGAEKHLRNQGLQMFMNNQTMLDLSKHPAFIGNKKVYRFPNDPEKGFDGREKTRRCWVFDPTKI